MPHALRRVPLLVSVVAALALVACTNHQRQDTLRATLVSFKAARDGFTAWDVDYQAEIIKKSTSREEVTARLAKYRAEREPFLKGFENVFFFIAAAATANDDPSFRNALKAAEEFVKAVDNFRKAHTEGGS